MTCLSLGKKTTILTKPVWSLRVCSSLPVAASQSRTVLSSEPNTSYSSSGEKVTDVTELVWSSSVYSIAPVAVFQSRTVLFYEPDAICLSSGEKATEVTELVWPSSACCAAFQCTCTFGFSWIQSGIQPLNCLRTMLFSGAKTRAEQYNWRGIFSITERLYKANCLASWINAYKSGLSLT